MRVNSTECPLAGPWRGERFEILVWVLSLRQGKSPVLWVSRSSRSRDPASLDGLGLLWGWCWVFQGSGEAGRASYGGGGWGQEQHKSTCQALRRWGDICTQNRQIFLHMQSSHTGWRPRTMVSMREEGFLSNVGEKWRFGCVIFLERDPPTSWSPQP